jgi:hypothetical protein
MSVQLSFLFENKTKSCLSQLQYRFLSLRSSVLRTSHHKCFHCHQSIFSARCELLPILTFIYSTPQTSPLINTHTLITIPRRKSWARHALQGPTSPQNYSATKSIPVRNGQDTALWSLLSPSLKFCHSAAQHHIHTAPKVNPTTK